MLVEAALLGAEQRVARVVEGARMALVKLPATASS
jgi:hypothetical protein